jgi:hypothetical protein
MMEHDVDDLLKNIPKIDPKAVTKRQIAHLLNCSALFELSPDSRKFLEESLQSSLAEALARNESQTKQDQLLIIEARLKKLFALQAPWSEISLTAWSLFQADPSEKLAAKIIQLVTLNGSHAEIIGALERVVSFSREAYFLVSEDYRVYIVSLLWFEERLDLIGTIFFNQPSHKMLPIEKLYCYLSLMGNEEFIKAYQFYKDHDEEMMEAVRTFGPKVGVTVDSYLLMTGELAFKLGYEVQGRQILSKISSTSKEYKLASNLVFSLGLSDVEKQESLFINEFKDKKTWKKRLEFLSGLLVKSRKLGPIRDRDRPALDHFLRLMPEFCDLTQEVLSGVSSILADHTVLQDRLPNYMHFYRGHVGHFYSAEAAEAIWAPLLKTASKDKMFDRYWRGVAHFHLFMARRLRMESHLWQAHQELADIEKSWRMVLPMKWNDLLRLGLQHISKDPALEENARHAILLRFKILLEPDQISKSELLRLFNSGMSLPLSSTQHLIGHIRSHGLSAFELFMLRMQGQQFAYRNQELDRIWQLACELEQPGLAWTTATVLKSRHDMHESVLHAWQLSYEGKEDILPRIPPRNVLVSLFNDREDKVRRFLESLLIIGPKIPQLLTQLDPEAGRVKIKSPAEDSLLYQVEKHLDKIAWLPQHSYSYHYGRQRIAADYPVPSFIRHWPETVFAYMMLAIARRSGFGSFGWSAVQLIQWIQGLYFKTKLHIPEKMQAALAGWLSGLTEEEKDAWHQLIKTEYDFGPDEGLSLLACYICRLALMIYPHHLHALETLQAMQTDLVVLRDAEAFLLSSGYAEIRDKLGLKCRTIIPLALRRMPSIRVKTS